MRLVVLIGCCAVLAACSSVTGRSPGRDRSADGQGTSTENEDVAVGSEALQARKVVVGIARKHVGAPYRWGGSSPDGFDCSGFVQYVYAQVGVSLPHNAAKQYRLGAPVSRDRLEPGDVVFFDGLRHNGIYVGNGRFIHARRAGKRVSVSTLDEDWYATRWVGARRL